VLKKDVVSNLNDHQMNMLIGGWGVTTIGNCASGWGCCTFNYDEPNPLETIPTENLSK